MKCEICGLTIKSNKDLSRHVKEIHDIDSIIYFKKHPTAEKFCSKCKISLPVTNFLVDKSNNYGHRAQCIKCMRPAGKNKNSPICDRIFQWSSIVTHMKTEHDICPIDGFNKYLKEKYCPKCGEAKELNNFAMLKDQEKVYFSWCNECNIYRNIRRNISDYDFDIFQYLIVRIAFKDKCFYM